MRSSPSIMGTWLRGKRRGRLISKAAWTGGGLGLEVIGAGLGRTGTTSLKAALETLGYGPCYHMTEVFAHPEHVPFWEAARRGEAVEWDTVFSGYRAAVDWPAAAYYERLMHAYPDAKVILTVRDPERWYESARATIYTVRDMASSPLFSFFARLVPRLRYMRRAALMVAGLAWDDTFGGDFEDRERATRSFERLNGRVVERVPPEKLLVYEVSEGWGPLCDFLGVEPPDEPFPRLNDARSFRRMTRALPAFAAAGAISLLAALSVLAFLALRRGRSRA